MTILTVGSGKQFSTVSAAVNASHDGDTIYVQAGTYLNDFSIIRTKISIVGVGGMAHFDATKAPSNGKGFLVTNTDVKLDHLEFSGSKVSDLNGAGVRFQGGTLTVTNSYFHDNQNGILGGGIIPAGNIIIDHSEFARNGAGDGMSHNLYAADINSLVVTNSYLHDAIVGHEIKSRAATTTILNNRIADGNSTASYDIDLGAGGNVVIKGNYIQQGPNSQNPAMINYGALTRAPWPGSQLLIEDNVIVNQKSGKPLGLQNWIGVTANITGNDIYGLTASQVSNGLNVQTGNVFLTQLPAVDTSHPWAASPWDGLIWRGAAANSLFGTSGRDLFAGSSGADTFYIRAGGKSDTIAGFNDSGGHDIIRLEGYGFTDFNSVKAAMTQSGADIVLNLGNSEALTLLGKSIGNISASDFVISALTPATTIATIMATEAASAPTALPRPALYKLPASGATTNTITGDAGNNTLTGTALNDRISGGAGADAMRGGLGDDFYIVDNAGDTIIENAGEGIDSVTTILASYSLPANVENLTLNGSVPQTALGNALNNSIATVKGGATINGGVGNDIIQVGAGGAALLTGGTGNDIFVFTAIGPKSTIADFHIGQDLLDVRAIMTTGHYTGFDPLADHAIAVTSNGQGGSMVSVDPARSGTLLALADLQNVAPDTLYLGLDILWH